MIEVLVDRLRWPAALVRERAASQLGQLIAEEYPGVSEALMHWIEAQELESLAAIGLLPFIFAAARNGQGITDADQLTSMFAAESILSEMYLNHLDPSHAIRPAIGRHSGSPPDSWKQPNRVSGRPPLNVETECLRRLQNCERIFRKSLTRQFEYETSLLQIRHGESPNQAFWGGGDREEATNPVGTQSPMKSVYRRTFVHWHGLHRAEYSLNTSYSMRAPLLHELTSGCGMSGLESNRLSGEVSKWRVVKERMT